MDELLGREEALSDRLLSGDEGHWLVGLLRLGCVILQEGRVMCVCLWWWLWDREKRGERKRERDEGREEKREERSAGEGGGKDEEGGQEREE